MIMVSKNIARGREIKNPMDLSKPKSQSVVWQRADGTYKVLPVAFIVGWSLRMFFFNRFFWSKKI